MCSLKDKLRDDRELMMIAICGKVTIWKTVFWHQLADVRRLLGLFVIIPDSYVSTVSLQA